jgi:hypothetical protein
VLGDGRLWEKAKRLLRARAGARPGDGESDAQADGTRTDARIVWRDWRREGLEAVRGRVTRACAGEADERVWTWARVRLGGERMADIARELGYADGSGVLRVVQRLESASAQDKTLARRLATLRAAAASRG